MKAITTPNPYKVMIFGIQKETEKAVLVTFSVTWNHDKNFHKDLWVPKSAISFVEDHGNQFGMIAAWFINQAGEKFAYKGYRMNFNCCY